MRTNRELAMEWWQSLSRSKQATKIIKYIPKRPKALYSVELTGREIEDIWRKEVQVDPTVLDDFKKAWRETLSNTNNQPTPIVFTEVDFEMLQQTVYDISNYVKPDDFEIKNFQLFFKLLSTDPNFAMIAHKELSKLNK